MNVKDISAISPAKAVSVSWSSLGTTTNTWNGYPPKIDEYLPFLSSNPEVLKIGLESTEEQTKFKSYNNNYLPQKNNTERDRDIHSMCFIPLNPLAPCFIPSRPVPNVNQGC